MNSFQDYPLHKIGDKISVSYVPGMYKGQMISENFIGEVVDSKWIDNNNHQSPYGWLFTIKLEDGNYRSLYECKCVMMQKVKL